MPANVVNGLISFLAGSGELNASIWDGEVPRFDTQGRPINPRSTAANPSNWPVIKLYMDEQGLEMNYTFEDPMHEEGSIVIKIWGQTRASVEALIISVWRILAQGTSVWPNIDYGGDPANLNFQISMLLKRWTCVQEEEKRTDQSELLYRGEMHYECRVHTATSTN